MFGTVHGPELEWKESLPLHDRAAATLCAFANGNGGSLFVGVRNDGSICGVDDPDVVAAQLREIARTRIDPALTIHAKSHVVGASIVVEARVRPRRGEACAVIGSRGARRVYVREGSSSRPASPVEIKALRAPMVAGAPSRDERRVLETLRRGGAQSLREVADALNVGPRTARRLLVELVARGLVLEREDRRFWLTPLGVARMAGPPGGSR